MKFQVKLTVTSQKTGLDLLAEYNRLGFEEESRKNSFGHYCLTIPVSIEFAEFHKEKFEDIFGMGTTAELRIDSSATNKEDYEEWGYIGMVLSQQAFDESRVNDLM